MKILNGQFGVEIISRGPNDNHACIKVLSEDDDNWHEVTWYSSFWLDDMIDVLQKAKKELNNKKKYKKTKWGWEIK